MRILVAPGSYKGTMTSFVAADVIARTIRRELPGESVDSLVLADGGEGTLDAFGVHFGAKTENLRVQDPLGRIVSANVAFMGREIAVIETSQAIGSSLVRPSDMDPFSASSIGVGELIRYSIGRGAIKLLVTMGDSATMDMGIGMLSGLGVKFYSNSGELARPALSNLDQVVDFDDSALQPLRDRAEFVALVDTDDYLCGANGQVQLYGRQKGLADRDTSEVESRFYRFAKVIERRLGVDVTAVQRCTGSGGVAAALHAFLGADLLSTLDYLSEQLAFDELIRTADITITGEGCLDNQTKFGKVPYFVASRSCGRCLCIVGTYTATGYNDMMRVCTGFSTFSMNPEIVMKDPRTALRDVAASIGSLLRLPS